MRCLNTVETQTISGSGYMDYVIYSTQFITNQMVGASGALVGYLASAPLGNLILNSPLGTINLKYPACAIIGYYGARAIQELSYSNTAKHSPAAA